MFIRVVCNDKCILDIVYCLEFSSNVFWNFKVSHSLHFLIQCTQFISPTEFEM